MKPHYIALAALAVCACDPEDLFLPEERRMAWAKDRLPLGVSAAADPTLAGYVDEFEYAVGEMNDRVGCDILRYGGSDVTIEVGSISSVSDDREGEAVSVDFGLPSQRAVVRLFGLGSETSVYLTTYHELGHVFGLAHDLRSRSIMMPGAGVDDPTALTKFMGLPYLNDRQADALAEIYCP